jgi:hypothetical protein
MPARKREEKWAMGVEYTLAPFLNRHPRRLLAGIHPGESQIEAEGVKRETNDEQPATNQ